MIHIYGLNIAQLPDRRAMLSLLERYFCVPRRERRRSARDDRAARASLAGLSLLRCAGLSGTILYDKNGRPYLEGSDVDFNITHTDQQVFCAVATHGDAMARTGAETGANAETRLASDAEVLRGSYPSQTVSGARKKSLFVGMPRVGLDAENLARIATVRVCPLADRWFSERELDFFLSDPTDRTFLRVWTRKEALVKWTGEGLSGLREADTVAAESVYGVRFYEYRVEDTLLSLCTHEDTPPPSGIRMLSDPEVEDLFRSEEML